MSSKGRLLYTDTIDTLEIIKVNTHAINKELIYKSKTTGVTFNRKIHRDSIFNEYVYHIRRTFVDSLNKAYYKEDMY